MTLEELLEAVPSEMSMEIEVRLNGVKFTSEIRRTDELANNLPDSLLVSGVVMVTPTDRDRLLILVSY